MPPLYTLGCLRNQSQHQTSPFGDPSPNVDLLVTFTPSHTAGLLRMPPPLVRHDRSSFLAASHLWVGSELSLLLCVTIAAPSWLPPTCGLNLSSRSSAAAVGAGRPPLSALVLYTQ